MPILVHTKGKVAIKEVIHRICEHMDYRGEVLNKASRESDVECHNASNEKVSALIDYQITSFADGLSSTIDWYQGLFSGANK